MITPEQKDLILKYICDECEYDVHSVFETNEFFSVAHIEVNELEGILCQFSRMGLIGPDPYVSEYKTNIELRMEAQDFLRIGGFTAKDEILKQNIEKLNLEVQKLREDQSDPLAAAANIATIATSILSFFKPV